MKSACIKYVASIVLSGLVAGGAMAGAEPESKSAREEMRSPLGCRDVGYRFELMVLKLFPEASGATQSMYFIYNKRPQAVTLYQMRNEESSRSLFMNHTVNAGQWAVLATGEPEMRFACTVAQGKSRYGKIVDCEESLKVCEFNNVKFGLNNRGNYWIVNSNTRSGALREVVHYGIIPAS